MGYTCLYTDNDLQGTDGSGSLGGPDVRRRIPIKLISKQPIRIKPPPRSQRPTSRLPSKPSAGDEGTVLCVWFLFVVYSVEEGLYLECVLSLSSENFGFKQGEERFDCGTKAGDVFASQRRFPQQMFWDYKVFSLQNPAPSSLLIWS